MAISNTYNPKPTSVNDVLQRRQAEHDIRQESGLVQEQPVQNNPVQKRVGVPQMGEKKGFFKKVGADAALLAYAIPVGLAQGISNPVKFIKDMPLGFAQSAVDAVDPEYYKAHPLLGVVNLAGFVSPIAGAAKGAAVNTSVKSATAAALRTASKSGLDDAVVRSALETGLKQTLPEMLKNGNSKLVSEVARASLTKAGIAEDIASTIASDFTRSLNKSFALQSTKLKTLESLAHPVEASGRYLAGKIDPLRKAIFGEPANTAVARIYGSDVVAKNPGGFMDIERWAEMQVNERGLPNTVDNRQRIMQEWTDQNTQWASLTPEQRVEHFRNYAQHDITRKNLHDATGANIVTTKALPQHYVDAMVETIRQAPDGEDLIKYMSDEYGNDFDIHRAEIEQAIGDNITKDTLAEAVSKMGQVRSNITFAKFSKEVQEMAKQLEGSGYRVTIAPQNKAVSFASDILSGSGAAIKESSDWSQAQASRTAFGNWIDKIGLSTQGTIEGAAEFSFKENFNQRVLNDLVPEYGNVFKAGRVSIPAEQLFNWMDRNRIKFQQARPKLSLPLRTVFDVKAEDLVRAGFDLKTANAIESATRKALREVPVSVTGMGDAVVNYLRTVDKGFGRWMSDWYDGFLKSAYKLRYDWSPFFSTQQFVETQLNSALLLKDPRFLPGVKKVSQLGSWTAERLGKNLVGMKNLLKEIIDEPPLEDVAIIKEEALGTLQKTMLDYSSSPDMINIQGSAKNAYSLLRDKAAFEESIRSRNLWYAAFGQSTVRQATNFSRALLKKFNMTIKEAFDFTLDANGRKVYKNPEIVQMTRESLQDAFHYRPGVLTSPAVKTLNIVFFPIRFQMKTVQMGAKWLYGLSPASRLVVMNNWAHFANWAGTEEGMEWRKKNNNILYDIFNYTTAYEQMGQSIESVTKGRLFGGNAGMIGGVPLGFIANLARELAITGEDPTEVNPKTGRPYPRSVPKKLVSPASLAVAIEQVLIAMTPSTPFYSLTGGAINVSTRRIVQDVVRGVFGLVGQGINGGDPAKSRQTFEQQFKNVAPDYTRLKN